MENCPYCSLGRVCVYTPRPGQSLGSVATQSHCQSRSLWQAVFHCKAKPAPRQKQQSNLDIHGPDRTALANPQRHPAMPSRKKPYIPWERHEIWNPTGLGPCAATEPRRDHARPGRAKGPIKPKTRAAVRYLRVAAPKSTRLAIPCAGRGKSLVGLSESVLAAGLGLHKQTLTLGGKPTPTGQTGKSPS